MTLTGALDPLAEALLEAFKEGAVFVNLAPLRDPALVTSVIAQTLHLRETSEHPVRAPVRHAVEGREHLLG